jgi:hypothetical protein
MNSKPHRNNSDFQLRYFLAGSCYTTDGAWALLYGQKIDMEVKIEHSKAQKMKRDAKIMENEAILADPDKRPWEKMVAEANIIESKSAEDTWRNNHEAAIMELKCINDLMAELEPQRKYAHLPMLEANEAMQQEEWLGELMGRVENFILSQGSIPHDHLSTMRCHPDFETKIVPHIKQVFQKISNTSDRLELLTQQMPPFLENKL